MDVFSGRWAYPTGWSDAFPAWDGPATLVLVFGPSGLRDEPGHPGLADLRAAYPTASIAGCSTSGEVSGSELHDDTLTVAVLRFAATRVLVETSPVSADDSRDVGLLLGKHLTDRAPDLAAVLVFSEGLRVNGSALADGLSAGVPLGTTVVGGLAGDGDRFAATWVLVDGVPVGGHVIAVGLAGDAVEVGHGARGGWSVLGPERIVTRSRGTVVHELDDRPALELYRTYLGDRASGLPATALLFPLGVRPPGGDRESVRTVLGVDPAEQSLTFAGEVPVGSRAQLMRSSTDRLVGAAEEAAEAARLAVAPGDSFALVVSCVGRRLVLGQRCEEELEAVAEALGDGGPAPATVGFYSYGELTSGDAGATMQNQTMTVSVIRER